MPRRQETVRGYRRGTAEGARGVRRRFNAKLLHQRQADEGRPRAQGFRRRARRRERRRRAA